MGGAKLMRRLLALTLLLSSVFGLGSAAEAFTNAQPQHLISIVPGSEVNVVSKQSYLPISIRNDYPTEIRVLVHVQSKQLNAIVTSVVEKTIPANTTDTAKIPITAIVDGEVAVSAWLTSFSGVKLGKSVDLTLNVNAEVEGSVLLIFSLTVTGLLFAGTLRTLRKRRETLEANQ